MRLDTFATMWSGPDDPAAAAARAAEAGFVGLEGPVPGTAAGRTALRAALNDHGLAFIAEATTGARPGDPARVGDWWTPQPDAGVDEHLADLQRTLDHAAELDARFVTAMTGRDGWPLMQTVDLLGRADDAARAAGLTLSVETHRGRSLFHPWVTRDVLAQLPGLRLTADFSHWCVVCERLLEDEAALMAAIAGRVHHVHGRVGWSQGAQVADPRDPMHAAALAAHERWWDAVWDAQAQRGQAVTTLTAEWGAEGYLAVRPFDHTPLADLWDVACWTARRQRERFAAREASASGSSA